jgi:hypothetical protein
MKQAAKVQPPAREKPKATVSSAVGNPERFVEKPKPSLEKAKPKSQAALTCEKAGTIVGGYGFSAVKPSNCSGQVYAFDASRGGQSYAIKLNAASGELTEVRKLR